MSGRQRHGVAIVGCGWVAGEYAKAFHHDGRGDIRAFVSRTQYSADVFQRRYAPEALATTHFEQALEREDIDIVVVATPHHAHTGYVVQAAEAGAHVIVEKPVALTPGEVASQLAAIEKAGVKSIVGFVLRWNPLLETIARLIEQRAFGHIFMLEVDYFHRIWKSPDEHWHGSAEQAGTSMLCAGCHAVDALRWFAPAEPVEVAGYQTKTENPLEYPGTLTAVMKLANGTVARSTSCFDAQMPYVFNIGVYGTEGSIKNNRLFAPKLFPGQTDFAEIPTILPDSGDVEHHPFRGEVSHFIDCIQQDKRPLANLADAARTMAVCFAADRSAETGRPVRIDEIQELR
jgi:predicted dehydrogenase